MASKKSKLDHGAVITAVISIVVLAAFSPVLPEMIGFALVGAGGLVTGTAGWMATSALISVFLAWSDPNH